MTESNQPKKTSSLKQRLVTGTALVAVVVVALVVRGWLAAATAAVCIALSAYEELKAFQMHGHRPVWWPCFGALIAAVPLMMLHTYEAGIIVLFTGCIALALCVMCREKPDLMDIVASVLPLLTVVLPGLCLLGLLNTQPEALQAMLLAMVFTVSVGGDTAAYFVGSNVGGPKLCPAISPNKTISGAIGGLLGSVVLTVLAGVLFGWLYPDFTGFPPLWANALVGLLAGVAAQVGDLFASMVKRYCGIKDFGHLFPGHGGMLDRMDSILFTSIIIYCYRVILLGIG